jgi:ParB family chromosome partitioning protein
VAKGKFDLGGIRTIVATNPAQMDRAIKEHPEEVVRELATHVAMIPIEQIEANLNQPRLNFDEQALEELSASIKAHGIIQPITVRRLEGKKYEIISGERRFRASQRAGLKEIPAYIRIANDQQMLEMALIENIQREDLNAMEVAISYQRLIDDFNFKHEELATRVGKDRTTITNHLRLFKLKSRVQTAVKQREISMGHARALASITDDDALQISLCEQIIAEDLSVRAVEKIIANYQEQKAKKAGAPIKSTKGLPKHLQEIQDKFGSFFGAKVKLKRDDSGKGQIILAFESDDELNRLIDRIEGE